MVKIQMKPIKQLEDEYSKVAAQPTVHKKAL